MSRYTDNRLAELLASLPDPPEEWVRRASQIPLPQAAEEGEQGTLQRVLERADSDAGFRRALLEDARHALDVAGYESDAATIDRVRRHLELEDDSRE